VQIRDHIVADANDDAMDSSPQAQPSAENLKARPKSKKLTMVRIPNRRAIAIQEWEHKNDCKLSDINLMMKNVLEEFKKDKAIIAYKKKGYEIPECFSEKFELIIKKYIYKLNNLNSPSAQNMADNWASSASSIFHLMRKLQMMSKGKRLNIDIALRNAGHPTIEDEIIEALRFAAKFAQNKERDWLAKRVRGPDAVSHLIELLVDGLESSIKRRVPRTLEINKDAQGRVSFDNPFAGLLWELAKCLEPNVQARRVRTVLERL
jgi:hypothetical protein